MWCDSLFIHVFMYLPHNLYQNIITGTFGEIKDFSLVTYPRCFQSFIPLNSTPARTGSSAHISTSNQQAVHRNKAALYICCYLKTCYTCMHRYIIPFYHIFLLHGYTTFQSHFIETNMIQRVQYLELATCSSAVLSGCYLC